MGMVKLRLIGPMPRFNTPPKPSDKVALTCIMRRISVLCNTSRALEAAKFLQANTMKGNRHATGEIEHETSILGIIRLAAKSFVCFPLSHHAEYDDHKVL